MFAYKYIDKDNNKQIFYAIENNEVIKCRYDY